MRDINICSPDCCTDTIKQQKLVNFKKDTNAYRVFQQIWIFMRNLYFTLHSLLLEFLRQNIILLYPKLVEQPVLHWKFMIKKKRLKLCLIWNSISNYKSVLTCSTEKMNGILKGIQNFVYLIKKCLKRPNLRTRQSLRHVPVSL